jgi:hypothetical protein
VPRPVAYDEPPRRAKPITLQHAAETLAVDAGCDITLARDGLRRFLIAAHDMRTQQGRAPFAFKLHQFISGPGKVLATLEPLGTRHITLDAQRFAPGRQEEGTQLYPVHFCRDCGQEYHPVWHRGKSQVEFTPREIDDISSDDDKDALYGFLCPTRPSLLYGGTLEDLPDTWLDLSKSEPKIKLAFKNVVLQAVTVNPQGHAGLGSDYWYIPGKFRFCLSCGLTHEAYGKDINRLPSLSGEGRSSATTMLTLSAIRQLFEITDAPADQSSDWCTSASASRRFGKPCSTTGRRLPVTGVALPQALRASHAKAWALCETDAERLDVYNGFLLSANLDVLFDAYMVSFDDTGGLQISAAVSAVERVRLGLADGLKLRWLDAKHQPYLRFQRMKCTWISG